VFREGSATATVQRWSDHRRNFMMSVYVC
jgi:hypothetical protein